MKRVTAISTILISVLVTFCYHATSQTVSPEPKTQLPSSTNGQTKVLRDLTRPISDSLIKGQFKSLINQPVSEVEQQVKKVVSDLKQKVNIFSGPLLQVKDLNFNLNARINQNLKDSFSTLPSSTSALGYQGGFTTEIGHLPFAAGINGNANNIYTTSNNPLDNLYKFNFDHQKYIRDIQNKVMDKLNPDVIAATVLSKIGEVRKQYERQLRNELQSVENNFEKETGAKLGIPTELLDLSITDISSFKSKLITQDLQELYKKGTDEVQEKLKTQMPQNLSSDSLFKSAQTNIRRVEALQQVYEKFIKVKSAFDNNAVVKQLRSVIPVTPATYKKFISNPANLEKVLDEHVNLSSIQRLFFNFTKLDIGQNAIKSGDFSLEDVVHSGLNVAFQNRKSSFGFIYGKSNRIDNWMQSGLQSAVSNEYSKMTGFKFGTGSSASIEQSIAVNLFDFNSPLPVSNRDVNQLSEYLPIPRHKDATITYHSAFNIKKTNQFSVDLSKSFGGFTDAYNSDTISYKTNPYSSLLGGEGKANYAARIDYSGQLLNSDVGAYFKKVGLGYNNPGNAYLNRGETSVGVRFGKKFLKNKLSIRYAGDYRQQIFDPAKNYQHNSINNKVQVALKLPRSRRISLSYTQNNSKTSFVDASQQSGINSRLQADGSYNFQLGHKKVLNYVTLGQQQMKLPIIGGTEFSNRLFLFVHTSSIVLDKNILTLSVFVNKSNSDQYYFSTSTASVESNYGFMVLEDKIRLNSSLGYYDNAGWNKQIGVKQQISGDLLRRFNVDLELGYKKAVKVIHEELANQFYATVMTHYHF